MSQIELDTDTATNINGELKNGHLKKYLTKATNEWSSYLDVESTSTEFQIAETIDDLLIRFDEFEQLVKMIHADTEKGAFHLRLIPFVNVKSCFHLSSIF